MGFDLLPSPILNFKQVALKQVNMQQDLLKSDNGITINEKIFGDVIWYASPKYLKTLIDIALRCDNSCSFKGRLDPSNGENVGIHSQRARAEYNQSVKWLCKHGYIVLEQSAEFMSVRIKGWVRVTLTSLSKAFITFNQEYNHE